MDLSKDLRAARVAYETAAREAAEAKARVDSANRAYDAARRKPGGEDVDRARAAWALTLKEWCDALIGKETARDALAAERRTADREVADHLHLPTTGGRR